MTTPTTLPKGGAPMTRSRFVCTDCLYETTQWVHADSHEMTFDHYLVDEEDDQW